MLSLPQASMKLLAARPENAQVCSPAVPQTSCAQGSVPARCCWLAELALQQQLLTFILTTAVCERLSRVQIHVLPMGAGLTPESLSEKIAKSKHWDRVVAFRPTGGPCPAQKR